MFISLTAFAALHAVASCSKALAHIAPNAIRRLTFLRGAVRPRSNTGGCKNNTQVPATQFSPLQVCTCGVHHIFLNSPGFCCGVSLLRIGLLHFSV